MTKEGENFEPGHWKMTVFWDIVPCSLVDIDRHFRDAYCLHCQGDHLYTCCPENLKSQPGHRHIKVGILQEIKNTVLWTYVCGLQ
jgi:hypothetical protein